MTSSRPVPPVRLRAANLARGALGAAALARPRTLASAYGADPAERPAVVAARVLGGRHLAEAAVLEASPTVRTRMLAAGVDLTHALSMVALALVSRRWRRPALVSASVAMACAAATYPTPTAAPVVEEGAEVEEGAKRTAEVEEGAKRPSRDPQSDDQGAEVEEGAKRPSRDHESDDQDHSLEATRRRVRRRSAAMDRRRRRLLEQSMATHRPFARAAAVLLVALAVWLFIGQWVMGYTMTDPAQNAALRETGFAVVVALCGLRLVFARRSPLATVVVVLTGVLLVASGLVLARDWQLGQVHEIVCGALAVVLGALTWRRRSAVVEAPAR